MAMELSKAIGDAHPKTILCSSFNPFRREIYTGGEDTTIRVWEPESGKLLNTLSEHLGWVTCLLFCKELKVLFSASIDGFIIAWGPSGKILQKIHTGSPIYCMTYNPRRQKLLAGYNKRIRVFQMVSPEDSHLSTDVLERKSVSSSDHNDVVSCLVACEGRCFSAGYDRKIVIYDIPHHGDMKLKPVKTISNAHDAAISYNSWLITGSFDRIVKLWSLDGNLLQRFDGFSDTITSICYVLPTQTLWITANSTAPVVYDPRSGINVSEFVGLSNDSIQQKTNGSTFKQLLFVIGITNRKSIVVWKYNPAASITVLTGHSDAVECLTFTMKEPLLIFSGGSDGLIRKWERLQLNTFMYSQENLNIPKEERHEEEITVNSFSKDPDERRKRQNLLHKQITEKLDRWKRGLEEDMKNQDQQVELMSRDAVRAFKRNQTKLKTELQISKGPGGGGAGEVDVAGGKSARQGVLSLYYYEDMDLLLSGYEDNRIRVWGYNEEAMKYVPDDAEKAAEKEVSADQNGNLSESVSNRVAGMTLKYTLNDHKDAVTGIHCLNKDGRHWMISTGWDRRICITDLKQGRLHDVFKNTQKGYGKEELAADGIILDLEYCPERNEFGYASADKSAYIRRFSPKGEEMLLQAVLVGHEAEVTKIKWNRRFQQWVTGSEDRSIRIWTAEGAQLVSIINNDGPVSALCVDAINGCIIAGSQDKIVRVFDPEKKDEVSQKNVGHTDEIRSIIHIPVRNQYVTSSLDNTVRIWNAFMKKGQRRVVINKANAANPNQALEVEEQGPTYSELNPLMVPKLINAATAAAALRPARTATEDNSETTQAKVLEDELQTTLSDLEFALTADKVASPKKSSAKK
ncbi:quinon protein alcohol dehydrogenase-like superfamily [Obelidium mucronatum]|nr:quinon protein alcohol dehydrogenase-like superfamily [Obelidium mucronatum]